MPRPIPSTQTGSGARSDGTAKFPHPGLLLWVTLPLFVLDQATKWWALAAIQPHESIPVIPGFFNLVLVFNTGAAFGIGRDNNWFFLALSGTALVGILFFWFRGAFRLPVTRVAVALLLSGVAGNLVDRIVHGHVVDFLDFILPWYGHWPAFNVADSAICIAAALLIWSALFGDTPRKAKAPTEAEGSDSRKE